MGNSTSQRGNSPASGLGLYFSYSINEYLVGFFKQKSIFVPENLPPAGLPVIIHDSIPFTPSFVVLPPLIALQILYSAPGELWNWSHPKAQDQPTTRAICARDRVVIPTNPDEIIDSEEYTCVVSTIDGYPKITHFYANTVVDCHPLAEEFLNHCYICRKNKQMSDTSIHMDGGLRNQECHNNASEIKIEIKEVENHKP